MTLAIPPGHTLESLAAAVEPHLPESGLIAMAELADASGFTRPQVACAAAYLEVVSGVARRDYSAGTLSLRRVEPLADRILDEIGSPITLATPRWLADQLGEDIIAVRETCREMADAGRLRHVRNVGAVDAYRLPSSAGDGPMMTQIRG